MSLSFDGVSTTTVRFTTNLGIGAYPFSIALWMKTTVAPSTFDTLVNFQDKDVTNVMYRLEIDSNGLARVAAQNTTAFGAVGTTNVVDGNWHFLTAVFQSNTVKRIYVDGGLEATLTDSVTFNSAADSWDVGRRGDSTPSNAYTGTAAYVHVYERALGANEILQIMRYPGSHRGFADTAKLQWLLPFRALATAQLDYSGEGDTATLSAGGLTNVDDAPPVSGQMVIAMPRGGGTG